MSKPCPIKLNTRMVLAKSGAAAVLNINDDRIAVTEVEVAYESNEIDRSDVYTPLGLGEPSIPSGIEATLTITQELYMSFSQHDALMRSCPVSVTVVGDEVEVTPSKDICDPSFQPVTIEVVEVGGNIYRVENGTSTFSFEGAPNGRLMIKWEVTGTYVKPDDTALKYAGPFSAQTIPMVLLYKNSVTKYQTGVETVEEDEVPVLKDLISCPSFTFEPEMERVNVESACTTDGRGFHYVVGNGPATLAFDGVLSGPNSKDKVWDLVDNPPEDYIVQTVFARDANGAEFGVLLGNYKLEMPESADVEGFKGYNIKFQSSDWTVRWEAGNA